MLTYLESSLLYSCCQRIVIHSLYYYYHMFLHCRQVFYNDLGSSGFKCRERKSSKALASRSTKSFTVRAPQHVFCSSLSLVINNYNTQTSNPVLYLVGRSKLFQKKS